MTALAIVRIQPQMVIPACVKRVFKVFNASLIIDFADQIHVGTMVNRHTFILHKDVLIVLGYCNETSNSSFSCMCTMGWNGVYCETKINYCHEIQCLNSGVCRSLLQNYSCECLGDSYSGRHCEITAQRITTYKFVAKSFSYVSLFAILTLFMFVIIMDLLKYFFGIDPVKRKSKKAVRKKKKRKQAIAYRFVYINAYPVLERTIPSED